MSQFSFQPCTVIVHNLSGLQYSKIFPSPRLLVACTSLTWTPLEVESNQGHGSNLIRQTVFTCWKNSSDRLGREPSKYTTYRWSPSSPPRHRWMRIEIPSKMLERLIHWNSLLEMVLGVHSRSLTAVNWSSVSLRWKHFEIPKNIWSVGFYI